MTTATQNIAAAIVARLVAAGLPVRSIDAETPYSFEALMPCIVVDVGGETPSVQTSIGFYNWSLTVSLWIIAEGTTPKLAPEPLRAQAHAALYATNRTLGGLVTNLTVGAVKRSIDPENMAAGITEAAYEILYRSPEGTL